MGHYFVQYKREFVITVIVITEFDHTYFFEVSSSGAARRKFCNVVFLQSFLVECCIKVNSHNLCQKSFSQFWSSFESHILNENVLNWNPVLFGNRNLVVKKLCSILLAMNWKLYKFEHLWRYDWTTRVIVRYKGVVEIFWNLSKKLILCANVGKIWKKQEKLWSNLKKCIKRLKKFVFDNIKYSFSIRYSVKWEDSVIKYQKVHIRKYFKSWESMSLNKKVN